MKSKRLVCMLATCLFGTSALAGNFYLGPSLFVQYNSSKHDGYTGAHPQVSLGYGKLSKRYYLAGEIFAVPLSINLSDVHPLHKISAKSTYSFGVSILPGVRISDDWIGYLRFGVVDTRFSGTDEFKAGGQVGLGIQTSLTDNWDVRGEYDYTAYKSAHRLGSVKAQQIGMSWIYKFIR